MEFWFWGYTCVMSCRCFTTFIYCSCYLQYRWGGWSDPICGSCSVCSGGVWRMVLSVGRGSVADNNNLKFFFFCWLFQQILCILSDTLLHKFSSSYIERCTWCSHSSVWIHEVRRVINIMLGNSPVAWTHLTNFQSVDIHVNQDSKVSIGNCYAVDSFGSEPGGSKIYCICPCWPWGPAILLYNGYWGSFPGVKWPGHMIGHPIGVEVKREYSYTSTPPLCPSGML